MIFKVGFFNKGTKFQPLPSGDGTQLNVQGSAECKLILWQAKQPMSSLKVFNEMKTIGCKSNICTYTALVNAFAREGLC